MLTGLQSGQNVGRAAWVVDAFPPGATVFQRGWGDPANKVSSAVGLSPHKMFIGVESRHEGNNVQGNNVQT